MTREEYNALRPPEVQITLHHNPDAAETYVVAEWSEPIQGQPFVRRTKGIKFVVTDELLGR